VSDKIAEILTYINGVHMMRNGALEQLSDNDLLFSPGGKSPTLGELFKALGELEHSYIGSIRNRVQDWSYLNETEGISSSVVELQHWFVRLDYEMREALEELTEKDLASQVDRTNGVIRTVERQLHIYIEAMLIFLGKLVVYFQAMGKELPPSVQHYIV
jgi:uncharacterized damage-inducible protein DinB